MQGFFYIKNRIYILIEMVVLSESRCQRILCTGSFSIHWNKTHIIIIHLDAVSVTPNCPSVWILLLFHDWLALTKSVDDKSHSWILVWHLDFLAVVSLSSFPVWVASNFESTSRWNDSEDCLQWAWDICTDEMSQIHVKTSSYMTMLCINLESATTNASVFVGHCDVNVNVNCQNPSHKKSSTIDTWIQN